MDSIAALKKEYPALQLWQIENVVALIDEGNTIPFIARYRKEKHGEMDDQALRVLSERLSYLRSLDKRREEIRAALIKQEAYTDELATALDACALLVELEDIYRPYKPKRRTRAMIARERGLEPLSVRLMLQNPKDPAPLTLAMEYVNAELDVQTPEDAIAGAQDIIAEMLNDDAALRGKLRALMHRSGVITTRAAKKEDSVYRMYYEYSEPVSRIPPHRVLAIDRGEREGFLKTDAAVPEATALALIAQGTVREGAPSTPVVYAAVKDAYARLIAPSMEREARAALTEIAQESAIGVFAQNLNDLLMQPPVRGHVVLGMDPGIRTGCKLAVVDAQGTVLDTGVIYPLPAHGKVEAAKQTVRTLIEKHGITLIAIGNGTASRETESFAAESARGVPYVIVNEAGASVYSASKLAADEFPQFDVSLRSAVSIARRLQDPLAELVKIEPGAIGVGQYQHDVKPAQLNFALSGVVERCVNQVGVDLNTASAQLLCYVAGINKTVAQNIVAFRGENGPIRNRAQLKKIPKLGPAAFLQCAGFLRVSGGDEPLDNTGVHPESYPAARTLLGRFGFGGEDIRANKLSALGDRVGEAGSRSLAMELDIGAPTLRDIVRELQRPGRDPRDDLPQPMLRTDVLDIKDLVPGMELKGTVRNVTDFGAFVDIGVHRDGLVHISEMSERRIARASEVVRLGDIVDVWVKEIDADKKRISLTMKRPRG